MGQPYVGEIRMFAGNFAPEGWMFCEGQLLLIADYDALFALIHTTYGGDGQSTFGLPDLRGRLPLHFGNGFILAETGGVEQVTLTVQQIPAHNHALLASGNVASQTAPAGLLAGKSSEATTSSYGTDQPLVAISPQAVGPIGGSQPHNNFQPYLCVDFIISLFGIFPTQ